jgi:hypothetical protein
VITIVRNPHLVGHFSICNRMDSIFYFLGDPTSAHNGTTPRVFADAACNAAGGPEGRRISDWSVLDVVANASNQLLIFNFLTVSGLFTAIAYILSKR